MAKVVFDVALGAILLVPAIPIILLAAGVVRLTSAGPAFYIQSRLGRGGRQFQIIKLRTMYHDCEKLSGPRWSTPGDPRITPVGRFLRATHLDELPQLVNVLRLEMSLVGPRPERPEIVPALEQAIPNYSHRLRVRPGVTGLAQLRLPADTCVSGVRQKLAFDLHYIRSCGPWLDLRLVACTALKVVGLPLCRLLNLCAIPDSVAVGLPDAPPDAPLTHAPVPPKG
jgi:lipopolysaccharide/colanic/teichoic acid biosynthesis glycosyltransferase